MTEPKIKLGVSACLLGSNVRYDGGNKHNQDVRALKSKYELIEFCPEVSAGLGTPRSPIQLVQTPAGVRTLGVYEPQLDPSDAIINVGRAVAGQYQEISGFILKKNSPSCGLSAPLHSEQGAVVGVSRGLFADTLKKAHPLMPMIEEAELANEKTKQIFEEKVELFERYRRLLAKPGKQNWQAVLDYVIRNSKALENKALSLTNSYQAHALPEVETLVSNYFAELENRRN